MNNSNSLAYLVFECTIFCNEFEMRIGWPCIIKCSIFKSFETSHYKMVKDYVLKTLISCCSNLCETFLDDHYLNYDIHVIYSFTGTEAEVWPDISRSELCQHTILFYSQGPLNGHLTGIVSPAPLLPPLNTPLPSNHPHPHYIFRKQKQ